MTQTVPSIFTTPPNVEATPSAASHAPSSATKTNPPAVTAAPTQAARSYTAAAAAVPGAGAGAGTAHNLPQEIRDVAKPRGQVIAWSQLDPALDGEISKYICVRTFGLFAMPCFWCHLCILWPCLWAGKVATENAVRSQYWILTEYELKIVSLDHDQCCCPNMMKTGNVVQTIPLENITDCGLDARGTGWVNNMAGDVPSVYVDTASSGGKEQGHEAVGIGLKDYDWLIQQILHQRDVVKQGGAMPSSGGIVAQSMTRPGSAAAGANTSTTADRLEGLARLRDGGIITESEFQQQRQAIIASI